MLTAALIILTQRSSRDSEIISTRHHTFEIVPAEKGVCASISDHPADTLLRFVPLPNIKNPCEVEVNPISVESPSYVTRLIPSVLVVCNQEMWIHYCGVSVNATNMQRNFYQLSTTTLMNKVYYIQEND